MRGRGQSRAAFDDSSDVYYNDGVFTDGSCRVGAGPLPLRASLPSGPSRAAGAAIALEDVSLSLGGPGLETEILRGTSLRVANGEFACLLGPSGSGKSTILNLLAGLARPTAGRVLRGGTPVEGPGPDRALVFQDAALFPWLTLQDNVEFPLKVQKMSARDRADRSEELLRLVHLWSFAARYPHQLSGGMRQRGAIPAPSPPTPLCCSWTSRSPRSMRRREIFYRQRSSGSGSRQARRSSSSRITYVRLSGWATTSC